MTPFHHSCNWLAVRWRLQKNQDNQSFRKLIHFGLECRRVTYLLQKSDISSPNENTGVHHTKSIRKSKYIYWNTSSAVCDIPCIKYWQPISAAFPEARFSILFSILNSTTKNIKDVEHKEHLLNMFNHRLVLTVRDPNEWAESLAKVLLPLLRQLDRLDWARIQFLDDTYSDGTGKS